MDSDNNSEIESELKKLGYWNNIYSKQNYFETNSLELLPKPFA